MLDRFGHNGGGLLAAGIAFNVLFAVIPLAIFASGLIGFLVSDPASQEAVAEFLAGLAPPLAAFLNQAIGDLANASASLTIVGLIGAAWGATRLYTSVELGIQAMFTGVKRRSLVAKTVRRAAFILVLGAFVVAAIVLSAAASLVLDRSPASGLVAAFRSVGLFALPFILTVLAFAGIYRVVPPVPPPPFALWPPSIAVGVLTVVVSQVFALIAPRLAGTNVFYGTLGTVFVTLAWLNLLASILLIGAAWVRVRMLTDEDVAASVE